ncbi:MAG: phenylalanine--tRNA ligase subunit beta [Acidimicrobiia bacterium]
MRVPLSWLREFADIPGAPADIAAALDDLGLVVDALEQPGNDITGVVTATVLDVVDHPNADRLTLVDVDRGGATVRVVCGAKNLASGDVVPYAPVGAVLPGGVALERRTIRGEVSEGMLCSASELGIGDDHSGILHLGTDTPPGVDAVEALGLDDVVFDVDVTPNRADAMCVVGVARDLAAHTGAEFSLPTPDVPTSGDPGATEVSVTVEEPERCTRFTARVIEVGPGPSPAWMAQRLRLAGMRPISNIVDVTNYAMLERGQPLHAFDLDLLAGPGIVVRCAEPGEALTTLDGVERTLTDEDLLVCDADRVGQAVAGVMGGGATEVSDSTMRILLEAAHFEASGIARTSHRLGLRSEASARFERGVDPDGVLRGSDRAAELLAEVAGAHPVPDPVDHYPVPAERPRIRVRAPRVSDLLGIERSAGEIATLLEPLGISADVSGDDPTDLDVRPPTFRPDLGREIDIIEEVARRIGYNAIERTTPVSPGHAGGLSPDQRDRRLVADALAGAGCDEAVTLSFLAPSDLEAAGLPPEGVEVENPLRAEESLLRPRLLPGLLAVARLNGGRQLPDVSLFETGRVFGPPPEGQVLPDERDAVAGLLVGSRRPGPHTPTRDVDVYDIVDVWSAVLEALALSDHRLEPGDSPGLRPGRSAYIVLDGTPVGSLGEVAAPVIEAFSLSGVAVAFEADLDAVLAASRRSRTLHRPSRFPMSSIDLAFVVASDVPAAALARTMHGADDLVESVRCFDEYTGDELGEGRRSLAYAVALRADDRTLTDAEVGEARARLIEAVETAHGATLRA